MAIFNTIIGYQGQDLHILRNNESFPLHEFFDKDSTLSYTFRLNENATPSDPNYPNYENITITEGTDANNRKTVFIKAGPRSASMAIDNFYVTVQGDGDTAVILVQLHAAIDKFWLSPKLLSFRKGMAVKHGLLVSFTDGNYADLSFYYGILINKDPNSLAPVVLDSNNRLIWNVNITTPTIPGQYDNIVEVTLPPYMQNVGQTLKASGSLKILEDLGTLKFHSGDKGDIDKRVNILLLSDGFDDDSNNLKDFHKIVTAFQKQLFSKETYAPWNFLSTKTNIWSYYTKAEGMVASLEREYINLSASTVSEPTVVSLFKFMQVFDSNVALFGTTESLLGTDPLPRQKYIDLYLVPDYPQQFIDFLELNAASSNLKAAFPLFHDGNGVKLNANNLLTLQDLCSRVGLPSQADLGKDLDAKVAEWRVVNWIPDVRIKKELNKQFFLHDYVFNMWKKLSPRIALEKADTSYGIINTYTQRSSRNIFVPAPYLGVGLTKFPIDSLTTYGSFIHKISGSESPNLGNKYFDSNGDPVLDINTKLGRVLKNSDNTVILSRIRSNNLYGTNAGYPYRIPDPAASSKFIDYYVHRSTVSLERKGNNFFRCSATDADSTNPKKYKQKDITTGDGNNHVRNTIIHEFSHNYLVDEYSLKPGDLSADSTEVSRISELVKYSNVEIGKNLETSTNFIDGNKIKWRWPRIKKIGEGIFTEGLDNDGNPIKVGISEVDAANNIYECLIQTNAINIEDERHSFAKLDKILLRRRVLFDVLQNIPCIVDSIVNEVDYQQKIKFQTSTALNLEEFSDGFILVLPVWRESTVDEFEELIHHDIREAISTTNYPVQGINKLGRPLVMEDNNKNDQAQQIDSGFSTPNTSLLKKWSNHSEIVGLFAGGYLSYNKGIYHATNFCLMRGAKENVANSFCPVCSYIIIDYINPLQHPFMDELYGVYK